MSVKKATAWSTIDREGDLHFHHLEDGWSETDKPTPLFDSQKGWKAKRWHREHVLLVDGVVTSLRD